MGLDAMILVFWMLTFNILTLKVMFSLSSLTFSLFTLLFHLHQEALCCSLLPVIKLSSAYLRLLIILLAILIPACDSISLTFHMMYSAFKLNKQGDNIEFWWPLFPIWNQSIVPCPAIAVASWPACRFLRRQISCFDTPISLRIFHSFLWSTWSKALV